jgi:hypothetical protein
MDIDNFCNRVVTIPQFTGTCWFNSILMSILYSQNSRKLLLHDNIYKRDKTNAFYAIINKILENKYLSREKGMKYFNIMRPENILKSVVENKAHLNNLLDTAEHFFAFLPIFIEYLGKTCITLDKSNVEGEYYVNLIKCLAKKDIKFKDYMTTKLALEVKNVISELTKPPITNPDYIFVNIVGDSNYFDSIINYIKFFLKQKKDDYSGLIKNIKDLIYKDKKEINLHTIKSLDDVIIYNGNKYILDSILLVNYNAKEKLSHAITGIKCKNQKYVYNGWIRTTIDPAKVGAKKELFKHQKLPCELMKFNWDINEKDKNFCLNPQQCKLTSINKDIDDDLCFSFSRGVRTLVYVKMNDEYKSIDSNLPGSSSISEKPKSPVKKDLIISRLFKRPLTSDDCNDWIQNKQENPLNPKNPLTGHRLTPKSAIYKELDRLCVYANQEPKPKTPPKKDVIEKPKTPPKKDVVIQGIKSKHFKRPLTSKDCVDWNQNKKENPLNPRNPLTGHRLKEVSPIYKEFEKICDSKPKTPPKKDVIQKPKTPPKKDVVIQGIKSKHFKRPLTSKDCFDWNQNKKENPLNPRNPLTGHRLKDVSPIYKEFEKLCNYKPKSPPKKDLIKTEIVKRPLTSKDCNDWNKNKKDNPLFPINPLTGYAITETNPTYQELDKLCDFCNKVVTIPQYIGTCWFNAMLMSILYSQYSRKLLLHGNVYANAKTNKLYKIINRILTKTYISKEKALKYFNIMRPEKILESYIDSPKYMKIFEKRIADNFSFHLPSFIASLGKTSITLDKTKNNSYHLNLMKIYNIIRDDFNKNEYTESMTDLIHKNFKSFYNKLFMELKENNPDYIFVNDDNGMVDIIISTFFKDTNDYNIDNPDNKIFKFDGLKTHEPLIFFNGDTYILDSCLLSDYKNTHGSHVIAGITCKDNKYVYNGWIRTTKDPSIVNKELFKDTPMPCELMKFNWFVNKDKEFCLNSKICKLDKVKKDTDLCFSFGKGQRTLIYVKMNETYKSIDRDTLKSST